MPSLGSWRGRVRSRSDDMVCPVLTAPLSEAGTSYGGPFRGIADDGNIYFIKSLATCPRGRGSTLAVEMIVARVGLLIGAPVRACTVIRIPHGLAGWEIRKDIHLDVGWAHASLAIEHADERGRPRLLARSKDDNRRRHVGAYALYDWCFGVAIQ